MPDIDFGRIKAAALRRGLRSGRALRSARTVARRVLGLQSHNSHLLDVLNCCDGVLVTEKLTELYAVERELGVGQTAVVHEGLRRSGGAKRALKCFKAEELRSNPHAVDALRAEVEILRRLPPHQYIITLHEVLSTPTTVVLATELVAGGDMLIPIETRGAYQEQHARRLFAQMIEAIEHLHLVGIVHRDVKLENICFCDSKLERIKIIDFGAADFLSPAGFSEACGTVLYAAPEMVPWLMPNGKAASPYYKEVDYWSMGISLFVMLTGLSPFDQDQGDDKLLRQVLAATVTFSRPAWAKISPDAQDVVRRLLQANPEDRATATSLRKHRWYMCGRQVLAPKAPVPQRLRPLTPEESPEDLDVLAALGFLSKVYRPFKGGGGPRGDLRLLVTPEPGVSGAVAVYTVRLESEWAFVLPARQIEQPLAVVAVSRVQLLRWVVGDGPLLPPEAQLPPNSALAACLACFDPNLHSFQTYLQDRGEMPPTIRAILRSAASAAASRQGGRRGHRRALSTGTPTRSASGRLSVPQWSHKGADVLSTVDYSPPRDVQPRDLAKLWGAADGAANGADAGVSGSVRATAEGAARRICESWTKCTQSWRSRCLDRSQSIFV